MRTPVTLKSLIQESKDGEWGKGEPFDNSVEMAVIRGTDFEQVRSSSSLDLPIRYIPKRIADRKTLQSNDIIFETAGGSKDRPTGRSVFLRSSTFQKLGLPLTCASFSRFIRIDPNKADPEYIFWHLQYLYEVGYLLQYHTQHTGVARFQYTTFSENELLLIPERLTQRKIVSILSNYDRLIENNTRRIQILEEMARSLYDEWFVKFHFPGYEQTKLVNSELRLIPEDWQAASLGNYIGTQKGFAFKSQWYQEFGTSIVKVSNFTDDSIDCKALDKVSEEVAEQYRKYELFTDEIVIQTVGSWPSNPQSVVGKVIRVPKQAEGMLLNQNAVRLKPTNSISNTFLFYLLKTDTFKDYIIGCAQGAASQASITLEAIRGFSFLLPPPYIAQTFQNFVHPIWNKINNLRIRNHILAETRDLLLPKLISGEIDVESLEIENEGKAIVVEEVSEVREAIAV